MASSPHWERVLEAKRKAGEGGTDKHFWTSTFERDVLYPSISYFIIGLFFILHPSSFS
jgi:hypothetical protein